MKKAKCCILFMLLCVLVPFPARAHADKTSARATARADANKSSKKYLKQQKKSEKAQKKVTDAWKKRHNVAH